MVAAEVKALAGQTARATEEISGQIATIQGATSTTVTAIGRISEIIDRIDQTSTAIGAAVEEQLATTSEITRSVSEASGGAGAVSESMAGVMTTARASSTAAQAVLDATHNVDRQSEAVSAAVKVFLEQVERI